ncbi:hypothetical protein DY023_10460 [Microbacterium bovistercoris]|uniref:Lipoprotein n=1 Tax=Microbacterium bovistercoris TaxID=2293570 RepID=A0A371NU61_9MICO|nr:hypothetical protein [Microbacterium bovistercoris]REJ05269.1 hypothetical protein DY023_10460 [Microbacterium bovistercoris]
MNRRIAAIAIAAVAILGLSACSGTPASDSSSGKSSSASKEAPETTDQSVADACKIATDKVSAASSGLQDIDMSKAASDPQGTIDALTTLVDSLGEASESVSNPEVKAAVTDFHDSYAQLRDVFKKVVVDGDTSAASDISTLTGDLNDSVKALTELCTA